MLEQLKVLLQVIFFTLDFKTITAEKFIALICIELSGPDY